MCVAFPADLGNTASVNKSERSASHCNLKCDLQVKKSLSSQKFYEVSCVKQKEAKKLPAPFHFQTGIYLFSSCLTASVQAPVKQSSAPDLSVSVTKEGRKEGKNSSLPQRFT